MFAVIKTGGKQYRVVANDVIQIERIEGDEGSRVSFANVLMTGDGSNVSIGTPSVDGASVTAEIVEHDRSKKTISFKKRRRQNSRRKKGHRQLLTTVSILEILTDGKKPSVDASGKSGQQRREEAEAEYLSSIGAPSADGAKASRKRGGTSAKGGAAAGSGLTAEGDAGSADPAGTGTDASAIEAQEATADALSDDAKGSKPKKASKPAKGSSVPSEDDEAADREAEMKAEREQGGKAAGSTKPAAAKGGSEPTKELPDEPLFKAPDAEPDKLTKIKGIGPVAERQLNEQGITTFAQIAALSDEDVVRIDEYMPFSDAQIRTWREQAEELK